jgi:hypothetical protein
MSNPKCSHLLVGYLEYILLMVVDKDELHLDLDEKSKKI